MNETKVIQAQPSKSIALRPEPGQQSITLHKSGVIKGHPSQPGPAKVLMNGNLIHSNTPQLVMANPRNNNPYQILSNNMQNYLNIIKDL